MYFINDKEYKCSVELTLDIFNDKWKLLIIWDLLKNEKRFKDLNASIPQITQKTLSMKLKELESKHIVHREVFAQVPPKVVYSLTPIGKKLKAVLEAMSDWGMEYVNKHGKSDGNFTCNS